MRSDGVLVKLRAPYCAACKACLKLAINAILAGRVHPDMRDGLIRPHRCAQCYDRVDRARTRLDPPCRMCDFFATSQRLLPALNPGMGGLVQ